MTAADYEVSREVRQRPALRLGYAVIRASVSLSVIPGERKARDPESRVLNGARECDVFVVFSGSGFDQSSSRA
jgi:hypothetical protein